MARTEIAALPDGRPQRVRLSWRPRETGRIEYTIAAEPQPGEPPYDRNRLAGAIDVRKEKISVLLAAATPSFEYRYLSNLLRQEKTVALKTVLQDADAKNIEQDPTALAGFPLRRDELFAFDVVILDDVNPAELGPAALMDLSEFVRRPGKGGALVVIAGPAHVPAEFRDTSLAGLLPIVVESSRPPRPGNVLTKGFVVRPTDLGLASPGLQLGDSPEETGRIWRNLPPLYWLLEAPELKPGARVLAEHPTRIGPDGRRLPVISFQYVGAGRVLFHATDETWRRRYRAGDLYFGRYWIQTLRWLCHWKLAEAGQAVTLSADRREYVEGEPVRLRARFGDERMAPPEDEGVAVAVERSGRKTQQVQLRRTAVGRGAFEGTLDRLPPGNYHASIARPTVEGSAAAVDFAVARPQGELAEVRMDAVEMRRAAEMTDGQFYTFATADRLLDDLPPGRQVPIESLPPLPLWNRWPVLALFLGLLIGEWVLRKRKGMV